LPFSRRCFELKTSASGFCTRRRCFISRNGSDAIETDAARTVVLLNDVNINPLRNLPSVEGVLRAGPGALAVSRFGQKLATDAARRVLARVRPALTAAEHNVPDAAAIAAEAFTAVLMKVHTSNFSDLRHFLRRRAFGQPTASSSYCADRVQSYEARVAPRQSPPGDGSARR
jgi:hypothetical protein